MDVKGSLELLELISILAVDYKAAMADGKLSLFDLPKFADALPKLRDFARDAKGIPAELKDLDASETQVLLTSLVDAVTKVLDAVFSVQVP